MKLPHGGIDVSFLTIAIKALEKINGPKMLPTGSDGTQEFFRLLAEVQHAHKMMPDVMVKKSTKKEGK